MKVQAQVEQQVKPLVDGQEVTAPTEPYSLDKMDM